MARAFAMIGDTCRVVEAPTVKEAKAKAARIASRYSYVSSDPAPRKPSRERKRV